MVMYPSMLFRAAGRIVVLSTASALLLVGACHADEPRADTTAVPQVTTAPPESAQTPAPSVQANPTVPARPSADEPQTATPAAAAEPAPMQAAPATQPAPAQPAQAPAGDAEAWLDRLEARAGSLRSLQGDLRFDKLQGVLGDKQRRFGKIYYLPGPPARFAIHIDRLIVDKRLEKQDKWYIFDGQWLAERDNDARTFVKRQIVAPDAKARDPLALGEGPFALPVTARKAEVLRRFEASLVPADPNDPPNSVHLRLTPRPNQRMEFTLVDVWYDRDTLTPLRARTIGQDKNESIIDLLKTQVDEPVDEKVFDTAEPEGRGWHVEVKPWEG